MNKFIGVLIVLILLIGGFFVLNAYIYHEKQTDELVSEAPERDVYISQFEDSSIELAFDYAGGPDGYVIDDLTEIVNEGLQEMGVVKAYRIMNAKDKLELDNSEIARESSPAMQLMVFRNDGNLSANMWVDAFPMFSNIEMVLGEVDGDAVVGGANAARYTTDGLYITDNVVVASGEYLYHFTGSYLEPDSLIHQDFKAVVDSMRFILPVDVGEESGAKIDVQVACESALTYMLFETDEKADQFVAECIAGEHPDVIERYINDIGIDGATI